jgi:hypothetical protein
MLVGYQRDLISAVVASDTAMLSQLLSSDFTSHDVRVPETVPMSLGGGDRPQQLAYLEVLAGRLSDSVTPEYHTLQAVPDGGSAVVYAFTADHAIRTEWRNRPTGWQAARMIIMRSEDARTMMLDQSRK